MNAVFRCFLMAVSALLFSWSLLYLAIGKATLILNMSSLVESLTGWLLLGEQLNRYKILGLVIGIIGIIVLKSNSKNTDISPNEPLGILMVVICLIL